ncbi:phage antirepressor [Galliscardovia ingluviei]|nr:phage antirepressor [Galliscardovia ingluviei]
MEQNSIQQYTFENSNIRTIEENGNVLFCGKDVATALGYTNPNKAITDHCHGVTKRYPIVDSLGRTQEARFITEGDVYRLIASSKLPQAVKFEHWLFDEVVPSIRKHGAYMTEQTLEQALTDPDFLIRLATELKEEKQARLQAEQKIQELEPKAKLMEDFINLDSTYSVADTAKLLRNVGINMGQNQLYQQLAQMHWIFRREGAWKPYETHVQAGDLALRPYTKQGKHSDGTPFAYQPQVRLTGRGIMLLTGRLSEQQLQQALQTAL